MSSGTELHRQWYMVRIRNGLTSRMFFEALLPQLGDYFMMIKKHAGEQIGLCLNFSECEEIDGSVIPNLFSVGRIVKNETEQNILLDLKNGKRIGKINAFLDSLGFFKLNEEKKIFDVIARKDKTCRYELPNYCTVSSLEPGWKEETVSLHIHKVYSRFFSEILREFNYAVYDEEVGYYVTVNILENLCKQMGFNGIDHGKSDCFLAVQTNKSKEKVFISIADAGGGMYKSFTSKTKDGYKPVIFSELDKIYKESKESADLKAIVEGVVYRWEDKDYGLWNILDEVMKQKGCICFHSGKVKLNLCDLNMEDYIACKEKREVAEKMYQEIINKRKFQITPKFKGTHIEIELPLL